MSRKLFCHSVLGRGYPAPRYFPLNLSVSRRERSWTKKGGEKSFLFSVRRPLPPLSSPRFSPFFFVCFHRGRDGTVRPSGKSRRIRTQSTSRLSRTESSQKGGTTLTPRWRSNGIHLAVLPAVESHQERYLFVAKSRRVPNVTKATVYAHLLSGDNASE